MAKFSSQVVILLTFATENNTFPVVVFSSSIVMLWIILYLYSVFSLLDIRRRIELLQDFEMPIASTNILVSSDKQYIMASGEV